MKRNKTSVLGVMTLVLACAPAMAQSLLGTWGGSLDDESYVNTYPTATMDLIVQTQGSPTNNSISGEWLWLASPTNWPGCGVYPCTSTWSGTITGGGTGIDILGIGGTTYLGTLSSNGGIISGTFSYPAGNGYAAGYGTWQVTRVPEPATLAMLGLGLALGLLRRRRT